MKFKELSKFWKRTIITLSALTVIFALIFGSLVGFLTNMHTENEVLRNTLKKPDSELIGQRFVIERKGKGDIYANVYIPKTASDEKLPVLFNAHGGGFFLGDADEMDSQCDYWANDWNVIVVSINYTKLDTKPMNYAVSEITDTVAYFEKNADKYNADVTRFSVIGHSAGGFLAAKAAIALDANGFPLESQILLCPWTTGLPKTVSSTLAPAFFSLGGADAISQESSQYQEVLKAAGVPYTVKEYESGEHPFIHSPYPEFQKGLSAEEKAVFANEEQFALSYQAENDIKEWLNSLWE